MNLSMVAGNFFTKAEVERGRTTRQDYAGACDAFRLIEQNMELSQLAAERSREILARTIGRATDHWVLPSLEALQLDQLAERIRVYLDSADADARRMAGGDPAVMRVALDLCAAELDLYEAQTFSPDAALTASVTLPVPGFVCVAWTRYQTLG